MNPDLETFLQNALGSLQRDSSPIARVAVEPDYESGSADCDPAKLRYELSHLLSSQKADPQVLASHEGLEISIPREYVELAKSVRRIFLHGDKEEGPWIEVIPPGNWI